MNAKLCGALIRCKRLEKGWRQQDLCQGLCAVSYLSKIEQGKAQADETLLIRLLTKLGVSWSEDPQQLSRDWVFIQSLYDAFFSMQPKSVEALFSQYQSELERLSNGPYFIDISLLKLCVKKNASPDNALNALSDLVSAMDERQYGLWLYLNGQFDGLLCLCPTAFYLTCAGIADYRSGLYGRAIERLLHGLDRAGQEGFVHVMLNAHRYLGNTYRDLAQFEQMFVHYHATQRIAQSLNAIPLLQQTRYSIAAVQLELGQFQEAYDYFGSVQSPDALCLHKLAICCEKLGKTEEAFSALASAQTAPAEIPDSAFINQMCALVRFRLLHSDYLKHAEYGDMLLSCYARIRTELPEGFARFHKPWVIEWYRANGQYKQALELCAVPSKSE